MAINTKTGLRPDSAKNMLFGAGVLYKNFSKGPHYKRTFDKTPQSGKEYYYMTGGSSGGVGYTEFTGDSFTDNTIYYEKYDGYGGDKIGATKDGTKVSITPEYTDIEVDGVLVKMEGLTKKTGEKATMEAVVVELDDANIALSLNGTAGYATETIIRTKSDITEGDYIKNLALVAKRVDDGKMIAIVFEKALCTSGFDVDMKNKSVSGNKYTFEAYASQSDENVDTLPIKIINIKETI